jgi:hypothetical protein
VREVVTEVKHDTEDSQETRSYQEESANSDVEEVDEENEE